MPKVGNKVRLERDETKYPVRGSWARNRGKTATVVEINRAGKGPTEYAVAFGRLTPDEDGRYHTTDKTWFRAWELRVIR